MCRASSGWSRGRTSSVSQDPSTCSTRPGCYGPPSGSGATGPPGPAPRLTGDCPSRMLGASLGNGPDRQRGRRDRYRGWCDRHRTVARSRTTDAFLQLEDGRMGLVHISEIDRNYVKDVREHLREGDSVEVEGRGDQGRRQDRPVHQGPPGPGAAPVEAWHRPGVRAEAQEVHAPERGAPGRFRGAPPSTSASSGVPDAARAPRVRRRGRRGPARPRAHHPVRGRSPLPGRASLVGPGTIRSTSAGDRSRPRSGSPAPTR